MTKTKRRRFGAVKRITRGGRDWLEGSYPTPLDAFATWPDLPKRQYKMVAPEYAAELDAWLADAEKRIAFNLWTPPQVERAERERDEITFADYARRWADTHRRADGELVRGSARSKHLEIIAFRQAFDEYVEASKRILIQGFSFAFSGGGPSDAYDSMPVSVRSVGTACPAPAGRVW